MCYTESPQPSRRTACTAALAAGCALLTQPASAEPNSVAGLGNVENAVEGVEKEEKVAISSTSSTDTLEPRGSTDKVPKGEASIPNGNLWISHVLTLHIETSERALETLDSGIALRWL